MEIKQYRFIQGWHLNARNVCFGGSFLSWVDEDTTMLAYLASKNTCDFTTAGYENISFYKPCRLGDRLTFSHKVVRIGNTSMSVLSEVYRVEEIVFSSLCTLVCIDKDGKPQSIKQHLNDTMTHA